MSDHERIWLELHEGHPEEGRLWCQDNVWAEGEATEYVRADLAAARITALEADKAALVEETLNDIAAMMSEFVDNWPQPKRVKTALKLIAKTMSATLAKHGDDK